MLRKAFAFLLLINHINTSMFLPQAMEQDAYDNTGSQINDINSVFEFVNVAVFGHHQNPPVDEDDDNGQNFHLIKMVNYCFHPYFTETHEKIAVGTETTSVFPYFNENKTEPGFFSIQLPPPKYNGDRESMALIHFLTT